MIAEPIQLVVVAVYNPATLSNKVYTAKSSVPKIRVSNGIVKNDKTETIACIRPYVNNRFVKLFFKKMLYRSD